MLDWLIIGGGVHGVHLASRLVGQAGVSLERIAIVDPGRVLLERWRHCTAATGMKYLRSPSVHHLDIEPWALLRLAGKNKQRARGLFTPPYDRPALHFFNQHCEQVIETYGLASRHIQAKAVSCSVEAAQVRVDLDCMDSLLAKRVVFAMGASDQLQMPDWALCGSTKVDVRHIFDSRGWELGFGASRIAVVGGGISAAQVALRLVDMGHQVHLLSRHAPREHQFDSDPGWLGPKYMNGFDAERCVERRRAMITQARHRGSMPKDVLRPLRQAIAKKKIHWAQDEVQSVDFRGAGLRLAQQGLIEVDRVLLATGFCSRRPGGAMVDELIESAALPCAPCGYPIVGHDLAWAPRVFVSGPLAELQLGPSARNISGARKAGDRLVKVAQVFEMRKAEAKASA